MFVAGALDVALNGAYPQGWLAASVAPLAAASRGGVAKIGLLDPCGSVGTDTIRSPGRLDASPPATLVEPAVAPASPSSGSHDVGTTGGGHEGGIPFWPGPSVAMNCQKPCLDRNPQLRATNAKAQR